MSKLNETKENLIDQLKAFLKAEAEFQSDYYMKNEDNPIAEFVQSFGYGDYTLDQLDLTNFTEENTLENIDALKASIGEAKTVELIKEHCELTSGDICYEYSEVLGMVIGEIEFQVDELPDPQLAEKLKALELTDSEIEAIESYEGYRSVRNLIDGGSAWGYYPLNYERWIMVLDEEAFNEAAEALIKASKPHLKAL